MPTANPEHPTTADARSIIDANDYMTLATADAAGRPWASPVWFAHHNYHEFVWVSRPQTRHSQNIAARPDVAIVVFDSTVPVGDGQAVYLEATAAPASDDRAEALLGVFSRRSLERGGAHWGLDEVAPAAPFRLYVATVSAAWILDAHDQRVAVDLT